MSNCNDTCTCHDLAAPQRNHFFYGKLLDERSLLQEQQYLNQKRWMLNRLNLGMGVLCGLTVTWTEDRVCLSPGVAIDGCGREIVVPDPVMVNPWQTTDGRGLWVTPPLPSSGTHEVYLCLAYVECPTDFTPVLVTDCTGSNGTAPSTIVEKYALLVRPVAPGFPAALPLALDQRLCAALSATEAETKRHEVCSVLTTRACADGDSNSCVTIVSKVTLTDGKISAVDVCSARPVVYSNPELFEMLLCRGSGGVGMVGPPGPQGPGIDGATAVSILDCQADPTAEIDEKTDPGKRILRLGIPRGCDGASGPGISRVEVTSLRCEERATAELVPDKNHEPHQILKLGIPGHCDQSLTKITEINWPHDGQKSWQQFIQDGLKIDFSDVVSVKPDHDNGWFLVSFELSASGRGTSTQSNPWMALLSMFLNLVWPKGTTFVYRAEIRRDSIDGLPPALNASGRFAKWAPLLEDMVGLVMFIQLAKVLFGGDSLIRVLVRVVAKCDFLVDKNGTCVDGNHLRGSMHSGDGIGGGEFESWFELVEPNKVQISGAAPTGFSANLRSGRLAKREKDALETILPGFGSLATFFNK